MSLKYQRHEEPKNVTEEFRNLDLTKQDVITFASRAPNSSDKGNLWLDYSGGALYFRHPNTGAWASV